MLERISEIQGIGLLHQANGKPHTCQKATLIYADNGRGKSTLATVFRSVSVGDATLITHRKTVDGTLPAKVTLQFGNGHKVLFDGGAWSEQRPEVLVFDADFIERNVHSGGSVNTGHRKNLLEFALGEPAVAARTAVDKATGEAKTAADNVQSLVAQVSGYHAGIPLAQFEKLPQMADADAKIAALQKRISAAGNVAAILAKPVPSAVAEPFFDLAGLFAGLGTSLEDVHADTEQVVKQHVAKLGSDAAESWLSQGRQFGDNETCPYCAQATSDSDLIRAYQTHFNAAYTELKAKVAVLHSTVVTSTAPGIIDGFSQGVTAAVDRAAAWAEHAPTTPIVFDAESARSALAALQTLVLDLCHKKLASPAEPFGSVEGLEKATALWQQSFAPMQAANIAIEAAGVLITTYKGQLATDNIQQLEQQMQLLQASKRRHEVVVAKLFSSLDDARADATSADNAKKTARDTLDTLMTATLTRYEKSINTLLKNFGASFSIKGMSANFRGSAPRSEYGLVLRGKDVALEGGPPSFATALSEGDKRTLAFAFFVASTLADPKLAQRIVVIDDPMCSLDVNRKHHTRSVLKNIYKGAEQLIVLAHDAYFIQDTRNALLKSDDTAKISIFQLSLSAEDYTDFAKLDIDEACESAYFRHHRLLNDFVNGNGSDPREVAKAIRPMLEEYLHLRFPRLIGKSLLFGEVVRMIRDAVAPSPLCYAANLVNELNDVNDYAGQFHHGTNPVSVNASELRTYVDKALAIIHKGA